MTQPVDAHYVVEENLTFIGTPEQLEAFRRIARQHCMRISDVAKMAHTAIVQRLDPIKDHSGDEFIFHRPRFEDMDLLFFNPVVPEPEAKVDLFEAKSQSRRDLRSCQRLLDGDRGELTLEELCRIHRSFVGWAQFWAIRDPLPEMREKFRQAADQGAAELAQIQEKIAKKIAKARS